MNRLGFLGFLGFLGCLGFVPEWRGAFVLFVFCGLFLLFLVPTQKK